MTVTPCRGPLIDCARWDAAHLSLVSHALPSLACRRWLHARADLQQWVHTYDMDPTAADPQLDAHTRGGRSDMY